MVVSHYGNQQYYGLSTDTKPLAADTAVNAVFEELDTGDKYINSGTAWLAYGGGGGGGLSAGGLISFNGTASQTVFNIPHGLSQAPEFVSVEPASPDAFGSYDRVVNATNIVLTYSIPPPAGTANVKFQWGAGFVTQDVAIELSATSTTTFTNKTISGADNILPLGAYNQIVYKRGTTYYAANKDGDILNSSTTNPGAVIQTCLDLAGRTYVAAGDYILGASFAGINIGKDGTHLDMDSSCILTVPAGYTGYVIKMQRALSTGPNLHHAIVSGGKLYEATGVSGSHLWTGIKVMGGPLTNQGLGFCTVRDVFIEYAGTGVNIDCTLGFVNGCTFQNVTASGCPIGFDFNQPTPINAQNAISRDTFINCVVQDYNSTPTLYGFKNIRYKDHIFVHCKAWDLTNPATQKTATIHKDAKNIVIIGGIMGQAGGYFIDNSKSTMIVQDEWNPPSYAGLSLTGNIFGIKGRRTGTYEGTAATNATGLMGGNLSAYAATGTATLAVTFADGTVGRTFPTVATIDSGTGLRSISDTTCRGFNPIFRIMFKLSSTTNIRPYFGWASATADLAGDNPLNVINGVILTARAADTNFQIGKNNASGATVFEDTGIALNTSINVFDLVADDSSTAKWKWALYTVSSLRSITQSMAEYTDLTPTDIPGQTSALRPFFQLTTAENAIKSFTCYQVYVESD